MRCDLPRILNFQFVRYCDGTLNIPIEGLTMTLLYQQDRNTRCCTISSSDCNHLLFTRIFYFT